MNALFAMVHNQRLIAEAERIINNYLNSETENHGVYLYLVNPDGTKIRVQQGCGLECYEFVI